MNLLLKGLSFCPTLHHNEIEQTLDDLEKFFRWLRLKEFLEENEAEKESDAKAFFHPPEYMDAS